jgi:transposase-like protein
MKMTTTRKPYVRLSEDEKAKALKRHLLEKVPVSTICDELGIAPNLFYSWQQRLCEAAPKALTPMRKGVATAAASGEQKRIAMLEARLRQREEAIAELMSDYVALKKRSTGEL